MSDFQDHIIRRQVAQVQLASPATAPETQEQLAQLLQSPRYLAMLDGVLSEFGGQNEWLELGRIELDLGRLNAQHWETQLLERLQVELRAAIPKAVQEGKVELKSSQQFDFEVFMFFLEQGYFPIGTVIPAWLVWEKNITELLKNLSNSQRDALATLLPNRVVRLRLIRQFQPPTLRQLLGNWSVGLLAQTIFDEILAESSGENEDFWEKQLEHLFVKTLRNDPGALLAWRQTRANVADASPSETDKPDAAQNNKVILAGESVWIANAGVVLLHPFLNPCFEGLGWVQDGIFKSEKARHKAILLIHFLATGEHNAPEPALFLAKILCDAPSHWPLRRTLHLTKKEMIEADALLQAAIGHWSALKNTTPDGLREAFLQREGKLERGANGWQLTVEQKAQDILLGRLPFGWALSMVRLPWMKEIFYINWV